MLDQLKENKDYSQYDAQVESIILSAVMTCW